MCQLVSATSIAVVVDCLFLSLFIPVEFKNGDGCDNFSCFAFSFIKSVKLSSFPAMCSAVASAERLFPVKSNVCSKSRTVVLSFEVTCIGLVSARKTSLLIFTIHLIVFFLHEVVPVAIYSVINLDKVAD